MSIQRYRIRSFYATSDDNGEWVLFSDHEAAVREAVAQAVAQERAAVVAILKEFLQLANDAAKRTGFEYWHARADAYKDAISAIAKIERGEHAKETTEAECAEEDWKGADWICSECGLVQPGYTDRTGFVCEKCRKRAESPPKCSNCGNVLSEHEEAKFTSMCNGCTEDRKSL